MSTTEVLVGRVAELWRHPVKSMQGERVERAELSATGLPGDRCYAVQDTESGVVLSAKREPRLLLASFHEDEDGAVVELPDGSRHPVDHELDAVLSAWLGRTVRFATADDGVTVRYQSNVSAEDEDSPVVEFLCPPGRFFDLAPVHLLTTASLDAAARLYPKGRWDVRRFRPTILVEAADRAAGYLEDEWIGSRVHVGSATLSPFMPTVRCVMTTRAQPGEIERDLGIVKTVNREHGSNLGIYCVVEIAGQVAVGDAVRVTTP